MDALEYLKNRTKVSPTQKLLSSLEHPAPEFDQGEGAFVDQTPVFNNVDDATRVGEDLAASLRARSGDDMSKPQVQTKTTTKVSRRPASIFKKEEAKVDYTAPEHDSTERLKNAQDAAAHNELTAQLTGAGQTINEALSRTTFNRDPIKALHANADRPVKDYQQQEAATKSDLDIVKHMYEQATTKDMADPNGELSVATRTLFKQLGVPLSNHVSALDIQNSGQLDKLLGLKANMQARMLTAQMHQDNMKLAQQERERLQMQKLDNLAHQRNLLRIKSDKYLTDNVTRAANVANALGRLDTLGTVTPQDYQELQQLLVANMGITGNSTGHERMERYASSLGVKAKELEQFLTGNPQNIGKDQALLKRFKHLAELEIENFRNNAKRRVGALTAGNESVYGRNPDLAGDLEGVMAAQLGQISTRPTVGSSPSVVGAPPQLTDEDKQAIAWANANPTDERAVQILKLHGMK